MMHDAILQVISDALWGIIRVSAGTTRSQCIDRNARSARSFRKSVLHHGVETGFAHAK